MNRIHLVFIIVFLSQAIFTACNRENDESEDFINIRWVLQQVEDTKTQKLTDYPHDAPEIAVVFTDSLNVISFSGVCNTGIGIYSYSADTKELNIRNIRLTLKACRFIEWEDYVTNSMAKAYQYTVTKNTLIIYSSGVYNLYFNKE